MIRAKEQIEQEIQKASDDEMRNTMKEKFKSSEVLKSSIEHLGRCDANWLGKNYWR